MDSGSMFQKEKWPWGKWAMTGEDRSSIGVRTAPSQRVFGMIAGRLWKKRPRKC